MKAKNKETLTGIAVCLPEGLSCSVVTFLQSEDLPQQGCQVVLLDPEGQAGSEQQSLTIDHDISVFPSSSEISSCNAARTDSINLPSESVCAPGFSPQALYSLTAGRCVRSLLPQLLRNTSARLNQPVTCNRISVLRFVCCSRWFLFCTTFVHTYIYIYAPKSIF